MARSGSGSVRKGHLYHVTVAQVASRAFDGSGFGGRVEEQPQLAPAWGRSARAMRDQRRAALAATIAPAGAPPQES